IRDLGCGIEVDAIDRYGPVTLRDRCSYRVWIVARALLIADFLHHFTRIVWGRDGNVTSAEGLIYGSCHESKIHDNPYYHSHDRDDERRSANALDLALHEEGEEREDKGDWK